ncbi:MULTISPECIES: polysaccharide deacetylase family protein [unclassified Streptomyces]|uniref:polysaccharide deacetylase family protein n=1 Tax=unclassified Streptomyces TaxID=2593676 RepID=UPI0033BE09D5
MTDVNRHPGKQRLSVWHWPARFGLVVLALAVLALPFYAAAEYYLYGKYMSTQVQPPTVRIDTRQAASWSDAAKSLPATAAPVVLAYHDVGPAPSDYTVSAASFDAQLTALEKAGYRSLTTDEFVAYLQGEPAPPRSVYITFDDGPNGLWVYADRILARHHMHGTVFLITGRVDDRPYYLSWNEIARMQASGRWDFQDHTHNLHRRAVVDAKGDRASALANRLWLSRQQRQESLDEYEARVDSDLQLSFDAFAAHDLPAPKLFAYPFSEATERPNLPMSGQTLQEILNGRFVATMTNVSSLPLPASRRAAAARQVQRLEVLKSTTSAELVADAVRWTQVAPQASAPLAQPQLWKHDDSSGMSGLGAFTGVGPYPDKSSPVHYMAAIYRPRSSVDWNGYEVDARVSGLGDGTNQGAVQVRDDSGAPVAVSVSQNNLVVSVSGTKKILKHLTSASSHMLRIAVRTNSTQIWVDGTVYAQLPTSGSPAHRTGGITLRVGINEPGVSWPRFASLRIVDIADGSRTVTGSQQQVADTALLAPNASWVSSPDVKAPLKITRSELAPQGRTLSAYGAYQPDATARWSDYTLIGTISNLTNSEVSGALWVRVGSPLAISVRVYRDHVDVYSGNADNQALVTSRRLAEAPTHALTITVTADSTEIAVDGSTSISLIAKGETGGVGFSAYRGLTRWSWPTVQKLNVVAITGAG